MNNEPLHKLRVVSSLEIADELVDDKFVVAGLMDARRRTLSVMQEIRGEIKEGMTEDEARRLALEIFRGHGVTKHWHKPYIRFGPGTALTFHQPLQAEYRLLGNDPFYIDLGPVWPDKERGLEYEGDVGDTFVLGKNAAADRCAETARVIFKEGQDHWQKGSCTGEELYGFLKMRAEHYGYELKENVDGHRLSDFPHHQYSRKRLAELNFAPAASLWVLEIQIVDPGQNIGAFFEDLLLSFGEQNHNI
jgi:CDP-4-dehydro-6-deoxyglucose reductase